MPCEKCGSDRIITKRRILCPSCDQTTILDTRKAIEERKERLQKLNSKLSVEIGLTDYNQSFGSAIVNRELAAMAAINLPAQREYAIREWLTYTFLLRNLTYSGEKRSSNFSKLTELCREIIQLHNEIYSLEHRLALEVEIEDEAILVWTEREHLSFVPEEVYQDPDYKMTLPGVSGTEINIESAMLQEGLMLPIWVLLISEDISRTIRRFYHLRVLPFLKSNYDSSKFVEISLQLSLEGIANNIKLGVSQEFRGLLGVNKLNLEVIKQNLSDKFHSDDITWYFENLIYDKPAGEYDLSCSIVVQDEQNLIVHLPLYSLLMLGYATIKWLKAADLGRALNYKGEVVEDYFFRFVNAYDLSTDHPITNDPLVRVEHPELPVEIADIMGYDDTNVLMLECKFWNTPLLAGLEEQLTKFKKKIEYVKSNLEKFGLDKQLNVHSFFYTPYAPYHEWHGIRVLPTAFELGVELGKLFGSKRIKLIEKELKLEKLFDLIDEPVLFPIDASELINTLPFNRYRLQDGLVLKYDETELTVFVDLPASLSGFFICLDITSETFKELKRKGVFPGDIIRMIIVNLNGTWVINQLISFKMIMKQSEWQSRSGEATAYDRIISLFRSVQKRRSASN